jgi:hypothetical protein
VVTTLAVGYIPPQTVVTYNSSVYAANVQDIVNYALTLALSLLNATHNDVQMDSVLKHFTLSVQR